MSKKSGKELHPNYNSWYHARRKNILCLEWKKDFWLFVKIVGIRPEGCRLLRRDERLPLSESNYKWVNIELRKEDFNDRAAYMRAYRKANQEKHKGYDLKKSFGITLEQYNKLKEDQNNVCAICNKPETIFDSKQQKTRDLSVDHCHTTGKVRGLLCSHCNHAIGKFNDDIDILQKAIDYLKKT